jgi:predicted Rossmann fold nucleotide-binding protein DprA/Smf involved in DNA uptake
VLVTEAPEGSGALITTRFAAEQGRDVFAVPGNATSRGSLGCNRLIQDGAKLVIEPLDITAELNLHLVPQQRKMRLLNSSCLRPSHSSRSALPYAQSCQMELDRYPLALWLVWCTWKRAASQAHLGSVVPNDLATASVDSLRTAVTGRSEAPPLPQSL